MMLFTTLLPAVDPRFRRVAIVGWVLIVVQTFRGS